MASILEEILRHKRDEVAACKSRSASIADDPGRESVSLRDSLVRDDGRALRAIAEHKRASPSRGIIRDDLSAAEVARGYQAAGAAAISVLTDGKFFQGSLADLVTIRAAVTLPLLRKDFVIDEFQLREARAAGADAVLLIVAALSSGELVDLQGRAGELGLETLVEIHDEDEAGRAVDAGAPVIGVNHRNLSTFEMDMTLLARLKPHVPADVVLVAESGISTHADVVRLAADGARAILVGESLMRRPDPGRALTELLDG